MMAENKQPIRLVQYIPEDFNVLTEDQAYVKIQPYDYNNESIHMSLPKKLKDELIKDLNK